MPLVRYRTGDLVRLRAGSDPIAVAYGVEPFLGVVGRMDEFLVAPDGGWLVALDYLPRGICNVERIAGDPGTSRRGQGARRSCRPVRWHRPRGDSRERCQEATAYDRGLGRGGVRTRALTERKDPVRRQTCWPLDGSSASGRREKAPVDTREPLAVVGHVELLGPGASATSQRQAQRIVLDQRLHRVP
jgi:hypothetical protein